MRPILSRTPLLGVLGFSSHSSYRMTCLEDADGPVLSRTLLVDVLLDIKKLHFPIHFSKM